MTITEIVALASVLISIGTNMALYIHLSSTMNVRFDSSERRMDARFEKMDARFEKMDSRFEKMIEKMDTRFDSVERRLEMIQSDTHNLDVRLTKLEK